MGLTINFKSVMGVSSIVVMLIAYVIYIWQTARSESGVRPHPFSWFLWGLATGVAYLVQSSKGGGAGSWVVGCTAVICFLIGVFSLLKRGWKFSLFDWASLGGGLFLLGYYFFSDDPTVSAVLATTTDVIGYGSTVKKGWAEPFRDSVTSFALNSVKFVLSIAALDSYSLATCLYPVTLVIVNGTVAALLLVRRRQLNSSPSHL